MAKNKKRFFHFLKVNSVTQDKICNIYIFLSPQRLSIGFVYNEEVAASALGGQKFKREFIYLTFYKCDGAHKVLRK